MPSGGSPSRRFWYRAARRLHPDVQDVKEAIKEAGLTRTFREGLTTAVVRDESKSLKRSADYAKREERELDRRVRAIEPEVNRYLENGGPDSRFVAEDWMNLTSRRVDSEGFATAKEYLDLLSAPNIRFPSSEAKEVVRAARHYIEHARETTMEHEARLSIVRNLVRQAKPERKPVRHDEGGEAFEFVAHREEDEGAAPPRTSDAPRPVSHAQRLMAKWGRR